MLTTVFMECECECEIIHDIKITRVTLVSQTFKPNIPIDTMCFERVFSE